MLHLQFRMLVFHRRMVRLHARMIGFHSSTKAPLPRTTRVISSAGRSIPARQQNALRNQDRSGGVARPITVSGSGPLHLSAQTIGREAA
jgi:hypothetical protein